MDGQRMIIAKVLIADHELMESKGGKEKRDNLPMVRVTTPGRNDNEKGMPNGNIDRLNF